MHHDEARGMDRIEWLLQTRMLGQVSEGKSYFAESAIREALRGVYVFFEKHSFD